MQRLKTYLRSQFTHQSKYVTVRYMFTVLAIFATVFSLPITSYAESSYAYLVPSTTSVAMGERFSIDVYTRSYTPVNSVDITLGFDEDVMEVVAVDRKQSVITDWTADPLIQTEQVVFKGRTFQRGFLGDHKIASIEMRALSAGLSTVEVTNTVLLMDDGSSVPLKIAESAVSSVTLYIYDEYTDLEVTALQIDAKIMTDIDGDNQVTMSDLGTFIDAWHTKTPKYDFNADNKMTLRDFTILWSDSLLR